MNAKCQIFSGTPAHWSSTTIPNWVRPKYTIFFKHRGPGIITLVEFDQLCRRFLADTRGTLFSVARLLVAHHREAERLLRLYGPQPGQGLRTLDSLQLAVALDLRSRGAIDAVVCADARLLVAAQAEGFTVINPEQP